MAKISLKFRGRFNLYAKLLFVLGIFLAFNVIAFKRYYRTDFSINRFSTLSQQSLNLVENLPGEIKLTYFVSAQGDEAAVLLQEHLSSLFGEYRYRSKDKIKVRELNPFTNLYEAEKIIDKFKLEQTESVLIVEYGDQSRVIKMTDMAEIDKSGVMFNYPARIKTFKAEAVITEAIFSLTKGAKSVVYFVVGHGEPNPSATEGDLSGLSILAARIKGQNVDIKTLNLSDVAQIPEDAKAIIVLGPKMAFLPNEVKLLANYLENKGHLFLLLGPQYETGLEKLVEPYGVTFNNDMVMKQVLAISAGSLKPVVVPEAIGVKFSNHPSVNWMLQSSGNMRIGLARSLTIFSPAAQKPTARIPTIQTLIESGRKDWGETNWRGFNSGETSTFDEKSDHQGPLILAASIDTGVVDGDKVIVEGTKVIAVGASNFLSNKEIGALQADFFINALNWMLDQKQVMGISPKIAKEFNIVISQDQLRVMTTSILIVIPLVILFTGGFVWWRRRK